MVYPAACWWCCKAKCGLKQAKKNMLPGFVVAFDNTGGKSESMVNQNLDFHWVNHKIIMNWVSGGCFETLPRDITSLSNLNFFPTVDNQKFQCHNYTVWVSRILVEHLDCFSARKGVCVFHIIIPHKYSNKMAKKAQVISCTFSFFETVKCHVSPNKTDEKIL